MECQICSGYILFVVVIISFSATKLIFMHYIFAFASSAPFYTIVSHTHFVKFCSLDLFLNELNSTKIPAIWYFVEITNVRVFQVYNFHIQILWSAKF